MREDEIFLLLFLVLFVFSFNGKHYDEKSVINSTYLLYHSCGSTKQQFHFHIYVSIANYVMLKDG